MATSERDVDPLMVRDVMTLDRREITIVWPKQVSRAEFADIEAWFAFLLRKLSRRVEPDTRGQEGE